MFLVIDVPGVHGSFNVTAVADFVQLCVCEDLMHTFSTKLKAQFYVGLFELSATLIVTVLSTVYYLLTYLPRDSFCQNSGICLDLSNKFRWY